MQNGIQSQSLVLLKVFSDIGKVYCGFFPIHENTRQLDYFPN